jgi:hypothetical protein
MQRDLFYRLAVPAVALAGFRFGFGVAFAVRAEGFADIIEFFEGAVSPPADVAFVGARVDELSFRRDFFRRGFLARRRFCRCDTFS